MSNAAAVAFPELACAVPFYGRQVPASDVPKISAPLLLHYAQLDTRINEGWPAYEAALKERIRKSMKHISTPVLIAKLTMILPLVMIKLPLN